jgi:hypothetical protein
MAILILGSYDDEHACHVYQYLKDRCRQDVELFDSRWFPTHTQIGFEPQGCQGWLRLPTGRRLRWDEITAVYWRCYYGVAVPSLPDPEQRLIAESDSQGLIETLFLELPARWVNGWHAQQLHRTKPVQLQRVARLGLAIPATVVTNDAETVKQFVAEHGRCIFKPVQGGAHARYVESRHLTDEHLSLLRVAPVTIQEAVEGTNIRVFVAGQEVYACEIRTPCLDYRDDPQPRILVHTLPAEVVEQCRTAARELDLLWTGMDFRLTADGRYVFLEANPSPMFLGFEEATGLPLTEALVKLLTG